ncbi:MAG: hypothetical protein EOO46_20280 [Flavobacterium sp.]|nr:MAG: hypothetical protein EOO46_20280 [Flavobacterium sp.]
MEEVDYDYIMDVLKNSVRKIPIPIAKLHQYATIDRARKNDEEKLFTDIDQLSYIKDKDIIDNYLTEFGRANKPHEPMFYGAISSSVLDKQRVTAIAETSKLFQDRNGCNLKGELYTISRWETKSELLVVEVVFASEAIKVNPDIKKAFEKQTEFAKEAGADDLEFYTDFLVFISEQFARETKSHNDYKIAAAYTELVLKHPDICGVIFPSVQTRFLGVNVVFPPEVVDKELIPLFTTTQKLYKNPKKTLIANHKKCLNVKENPHNLEWQDTEEQYLTKQEYIDEYFKDGCDTSPNTR